MRIAILGARGIPACYSGYDTLTEELAVSLVQSYSMEVIVYCRSSYYQERPRLWHGVRLVYLPAPRGLKAVESLVHSFLSTLHVLLQRVQVVYFLDPANAPFCVLLRLFGKRVVIHTDGLGWKRKKWGVLARRYYKWVEWVCAKCACALVTDNPAMQEYYKSKYHVSSEYIAYGSSNRYGVDRTIYQGLGITPKEYILVVARLERENNTDRIIEQYVKSGVEAPLVVVGDAPYDGAYMTKLRRLANARVLFAGRINDQSMLNALYQGAYLYIHGHEVGGTNPSLLRAMDAGTAPVVLNATFNTTVVGSCGVSFGKDDDSLAVILKTLDADPLEVERLGRRAKARASANFCWTTVAEKHHDLFVHLIGSGQAGTTTTLATPVE